MKEEQRIYEIKYKLSPMHIDEILKIHVCEIMGKLHEKNNWTDEEI